MRVWGEEPPSLQMPRDGVCVHMCVFVWRAEARLGVLWQLLPVLVDEEKLPLDLKRLMNKLQDAECLVGVSPSSSAPFHGQSGVPSASILSQW